MVSITPDCQPLNYTHMYDFSNYRRYYKVPCEKPLGVDTIFSYIYNTKNFTKFRKILEKTLLMDQLLECQANFTIFITPDNMINLSMDYIENVMDGNEAKSIVNSCILPRQLDKYLLTSSPVSYYYTRNPKMRMYVTNLRGQTMINNQCKVIQFDIKLQNGIIHVVDNLIHETNDTFMN